jgi:methionyl aminopeptidase
MSVTIKTKEEIQIMKEGGRILAEIMAELEKRVRPGITTKELDKLAEELILSYGGKCSFKGYQNTDVGAGKPYPACLCTSINEEIVHAVPSERVLEEGDIISLDLGIQYKGYHTDMAITLPIGKVNQKTEKLIETTKNALDIGIEKIKPGNYLGDISRAIQKYVEGQNFNVVRELCGHGIGRNVHEEPEILNSVSFDKETVDKVKYFGDAKIILKEGMVLCLEPMVTVGDWHIKKSKDGFGYSTEDGSLSAHFEHTVAVTQDGYLVLTIL